MKESDLKPAICVLNPDDVYNLRKYQNDDSSFYCLTPYEVLELQKSGVKFPTSPHLSEGLVLTKVRDHAAYYFRTEDTDCRIINERCLAIEAILSYLGGKEFAYSETSSFTGNRHTGIGVEAEFKKQPLKVENETKVDVDVEIALGDDKLVRGLWSGKYTLEGYERAQKLAEAHGLNSDPQIVSLLEMRNPKHPNPIERQEYHVYVTEDLDKNVSVLEDIKAKVSKKIGGELKVDVKNSRKESRASTVDFYVSFGPIPVEEAEKERVKEIEGSRPKRNNKWIWPAIAIGAVVALIATLLIVLL